MKIKTCKDCWKPRDHNNNLISRCKKCYTKREKNRTMEKGIKQVNLKRTPPARIWKKRKERIASGGSEAKIYARAYSQANGICKICTKTVLNPPAWCFAHILSKKNYPHLRLFTNNIAFVCSPECHAKVDSRIAGTNKDELEARILKGENIF